MAQAAAAGVEPEPAMNPILIKPSGERTSQVMLMGRPLTSIDARGYQALKPELLGPVTRRALEDLRERFDVVVCEGAGSPAEINLRAHDVANMGLARAAGLPVVLVGDIDRGGVLASMFGTARAARARGPGPAWPASWSTSSAATRESSPPASRRCASAPAGPRSGSCRGCAACGSTWRTRWRSRARARPRRRRSARTGWRWR